ncbi:MAG: sugar-transfer associated ATP-grasp domain-containing protein [Akkermansia sp.]|nr:sugar-transfer associated ATP-grasp domain-containing protein [Akkermansia sp.]
MFEKLKLWRKQISARIKLRRAKDRIRHLLEVTRTEQSKSLEEVMNDFKTLIAEKRAFPIRDTLVQYFQYRLQYKGARLGDFIFNSEWSSTVMPIREWAKRDCDILNDKILAAKHFKKHGIASAFQIGTASIKNVGILVNQEDGEAVLLSELLKTEKQIFAKPHDGIQGKGCFLLEYVDDKQCVANNENISFPALADKLTEGYLFEKVIQNHPDLVAIYPHALNTIRIVTMRDTEGKIHYVSGFHRFGVGGAKVDNAHSGGIAVGLNAEKGCWKKYAYADNETYSTTTHPDSGFVFEDKPIPFFKEAVELAIKAHSSFERVQAVGWDVAITPEGPIITEGNHNYWHIGNQYIDHPLREAFDTMIVPCLKAIQAGRMPWPGCK